jgi:replication-associated recombination protein RarA
MSQETIERNLSVSLRPRRFSEFVGYTRMLNQIRSQFTSGRVPTAMLFEGMSRGGKTTVAKIVGTSVNCTHAPFGEPCDDCIAKTASNTFSIEEVNAALLNKKEDAIALVRGFKWQPSAGLYNVWILNECQQMTDAAQNVILDPLEAEGGFNIVIFTTTDPSKINVPVQKRCGSNRFVLSGLDEAEIKLLVWNTSKRIEVEGGWDISNLSSVSKLLWERQILAPGDVVCAVEALSNGATPEEAAVSAEFSGKVDVYTLGNAAMNGDWRKCQTILRNAEPKDGDSIRLHLAGILRKRLLSDSGAQIPQYVDAIHELAFDTPVVGMQLNHVTAAIWKICCMFKRQALARAA